MRNTAGSGRSKSNKDKGSSSSKISQTQNSQTVKSEGPPLKSQVQGTAEQIALTNLIHKEDADVDLKNKVDKVVELTGCSQNGAEIALYDNKNDVERAVNMVLEGATDGEWRESGKKKKKPSQKIESSAPPVENDVDSKPEKRDNKDRNDRDNRDRDRDREDRDQDRGFREQSDGFRRPRRNDNRPPRLSRGRGRPDRAGDRPDNIIDENDKDNDRGDRGFERGRGRGRGGGFGGSRRGRGGAGGVGNFRTAQPRFEKNNQFEKFEKFENFDNGPQIDTWTNETAVIGEKEPKISNWGDTNEDWNEDIDSWTGSLAETKVFVASSSAAQEPPVPVQLDTTVNTFDLNAIYQKHSQNDISAEASYINQFNQQATESIKNSIGIGSGSNSTLQNSMSSHTASNVSALMSLQNALHDNMGPSLSGSELSGTSLTGNGLARTSLGNNLSGTSLPVNSLTGSGLNATSLSGNSLTGTGLSGSGLTGSLGGSSLSSVTQSITAPPSVISSSVVSQNALLQQQRQKPQRSKLPPPSKIPASAVEMPGHMMTTLDVQFGNLDFGTDSPPFSFGGNESVTNAFSSAASSSTATINNHVNAQVGKVSLSQTSESMIPSSIMSAGSLEQGSPRNSMYQQSPYSTPTKQNTAENTKIQSPPEPLQMPGSTSDLKSNKLISGQSPQVSLPSTKIDSGLNSYSSNSSYQSSGYQSHKQSGYSNSTKPGSYPGSNQYPDQTSSGQYSSSQYNRQSSGGSQYQSGSNQYHSGGSQYQSPPSGYQSSPTGGYQSSQSGYPTNQSQYPSNQNQYQNFQSSSTFQNQSGYPSTNQAGQNSLYQTPTTTASFTNQTPQSSLYSQNSSHTGSYSNQTYLNRDHAAGAGSSSYPATMAQSSSSPFKDNQTGASSYRDNVPSSSKTRESQSDSSGYNRDTQSASSFSDSQAVAYSRDSQSVGNNYSRDSTSGSYKRDTKSAGGSYPRDSQPGSDNSSTYNSRDSQSASSSYNSRDGQSFKDTQSASNFRDTQSGSSAYSGQSGSYPRDSSKTGLGAGASQSPAGYSAKHYRGNEELTTSTLQTSTLQTSQLPGSKLVDSYSKMAVKEGSLDTRQSTNSQFDVSQTTTASKSSTSTVPLTSVSTMVSTSPVANTTVTSSVTTKISTLPTISTASTKAPPNLPPGVPLMAAQQYIMGQAGTLPFYGLQGLQGLQQPLYANFEDLQYLQQRMPTLAANNVYDMSATAAAAGLPIQAANLTSNTTQYSGSADSTKLNRVDAQSPTGSIPSTQQSGTGQTAAHQQQQPYIHLNYSYYYPPSLIPGAGFQYPMIPMPQVTNAAHVGTPAASQYQQQKNYGSHHIQYGGNKAYDELNQQTPDFSKIPYGALQSQPKANTTVTPGTASSEIQIPGYGKTHAQAFDKQGFHAGTPPPFNLQMATGQLPTGTQAGPLGAPTAPYGAPYVPMMAHQPHSQMMHHPGLQDTTPTIRGSQPTGAHSQSKSVSKSYSGSNWGSY